MGCYGRFVSRFPFVLILVDVGVVLICGPVAVVFYGMPDFSDPSKGFEPRGTTISGRSTAARFIDDEIRAGNLTGSSSAPPSDTRLNKPPTQGQSSIDVATCADHPIFDSLPRMAISSRGGASNLLNVDFVKAICNLEEEYISSYWKGACGAFSLPLYVAALTNKTCDQIEAEDVDYVTSLLIECAPRYFDGNLTSTCSAGGCHDRVPAKCFVHDAVHKILHQLVDVTFMTDGDISKLEVKYSMLFLRPEWNLSRSELKRFFFEKLEGTPIHNNKVEVIGMDLQLSQTVFNEYVLGDLPYYALAMALVVIILLIYLKSVVLMFAVVLNVLFTISVSYFLYFVVFRLSFFPFMNLLAGLLLIAVGADDIFILYDIWRKYQQEHPDVLFEDLTSHMLNHGALSIFVTSLTTTAALLANLVSDITAIRCFGIFAGVCIMVNFLLVVTWIPAVIVLVEKATQCCVPAESCGRCRRLNKRMAAASMTFWGDKMSVLVTKIWPLWVVVFLLFGISGIVVVFVAPRLSLPESENMQLFQSSHPFEVYHSTVEDQFRFEIAAKAAGRDLDVQIIWGVQGADNGDHLDPDSEGRLIFKEFDGYAPESQGWLSSLCTALKVQEFVNDGNNLECFFDVVKQIVEADCNGTVDPCCEITYPLNRTMARACLGNENVIDLINSKQTLGQVLFDDEGELKVFRYSFGTGQAWTGQYSIIDDLYQQVDDFVAGQMEGAPEDLRSGWFGGMYGYEFAFYDLQTSLASGTYSGIGLSLGVGFLIMLFTSLNVVITVFAMVTIALVIAVTVGCLVLLGWELNVTESLTITLSIGLSIDFTIHYGVAYLLSTAPTRRLRVTEALATVGSAVSMAALTTFVSGAAVMPGRVLSYQQFGVFLMLVMTNSWLFATFFFLAVCTAIGPLGKVGDLVAFFKLCRNRCRKTSKVSQADRPSQEKTYNPETETKTAYSLTAENPSWSTTGYENYAFPKQT